MDGVALQAAWPLGCCLGGWWSGGRLQRLGRLHLLLTEHAMPCCAACHAPAAERLFQEQPAAAEAALPPAAAATPQQLRLSLQGAASPAAPANTPASPRLGGAATGGLLAPGRHSLPVGASAVAEAIEQAATASTDGASEAGTEAVGRRASAAAAQPAPADAEGRRVSLAEAAAAYSPAAASPAVVAAPMVAPSPVPATPYAATEYDGEDVVMMDIGERP